MQPRPSGLAKIDRIKKSQGSGAALKWTRLQRKIGPFDSAHRAFYTAGVSVADLTLYHASPSRSSVTLWMLEELGQPYDVHLLSLANGDQLKPDYLAVNPLGKVPALRHKGVVITEAAAISAYLADEFPQAKLNVPVGDPRRGLYFKWLFFSPSVLEPAIADRAFPRKEPARATAIGWRDLDQVTDVVAAAVAQGPWLLGEQFTAADVVLGANIRFGTMFKLIPDRPAFAAYIKRMSERPAAKRADAKDKALSESAKKS